MKLYAMMLAISAGLSILVVSPLSAAAGCPCCSASEDSSKQLAVALPLEGKLAGAMKDIKNNDSVTSPSVASEDVQERKLEVTNSYSPSVLTVEQGKTVSIQVTRKDSKNCGGELLIPEFNVKAAIPVGNTTIVTFTPTKTGTFLFTCGMQMMKGQLVVKESPTK